MLLAVCKLRPKYNFTSEEFGVILFKTPYYFIGFVTNYSRDYSEWMVIYTCKHEGACPCALRIERKAAVRNSTA
jgi:hypothetical protein